jgi:hypothetical protein
MAELSPAAPPPPYRSAAQRARLAMIALLVVVAVEIAALVADVGRVGITNRILRADTVSDGEVTASDTFVQLTAVLEIAVMIACAVLFLSWLHRVVANGPALGGRELRYTPGWAVGWWFVPVLNLVRPFQVVAEAWVVSARDPGAGLGLLLPAWWGLFILGSVVSRFLVVRTGGDDVTALRNAAIIDIVASVVLVVAALLCVVMVRRLTERQELRRLAMSVPQAATGGAA